VRLALVREAAVMLTFANLHICMPPGQSPSQGCEFIPTGQASLHTVEHITSWHPAALVLVMLLEILLIVNRQFMSQWKAGTSVSMLLAVLPSNVATRVGVPTPQSHNQTNWLHYLIVGIEWMFTKAVSELRYPL
jgi:hypothetical protein